MMGSKTMTVADRSGAEVKNSSFIVVALVFMVIALVYVWCHIHITGINYEIAEEMKLKDRLLKENKALKMEIEVMKSPGRIEAFARNNLHMHYPEKEQVITIK